MVYCSLKSSLFSFTHTPDLRSSTKTIFQFGVGIAVEVGEATEVGVSVGRGVSVGAEVEVGGKVSAGNGVLVAGSSSLVNVVLGKA
jgi:hypothetical protein